VKSHLLLLRYILIDLSMWCCTSTNLDLEKIKDRVEHEGLSFLTITLPQFGKDFESCLDQGRVCSTDFAGYAKTGCLPKMFSGFTSNVFDVKSGTMLDNPSIECIHAVRQVCNLFSKVNLPCSDARVGKALKGYIECEQQVRASDATRSDSQRDAFRDMSVLLYGSLFTSIDRMVYNGEMIPKHGPGATADKLKGNRKFAQQQWTERLEDYFPHGEYLFSSWRHFLDAEPIDLLEPGSELPSKVITVPKTLKTPRIIAIESTCRQYTQQALLPLFVNGIEENYLLSHFIGFSDQTPNQDLALQGSKDGSLATLDLSEASDRVSNLHVEDLLWFTPTLFGAVQSCRALTADVPGYGVIPLSKFASMGSALCFPMEAMTFLVVIFLGIQRELNRPLTRQDLHRLVGSVRVYGDDIIVPVDFVHSVVHELEAYGFKVNGGKSFWTGRFRESCGKEYYDGHDVSVVKVRCNFPTQLTDAPEIIGTAALRNQLYFAGLWHSADFLDHYMSKLVKLWPVVAETSQAIGRHSVLGYQAERECPNLQRPLVKAYCESSKPPRDNLDGYGALLKCLLRLESRNADPHWTDILNPLVSDDKHLERSGRPSAVNIKQRWVCAY